MQGVEGAEINPASHQLVFIKGAKTNGEAVVLSTSGTGTSGFPCAKERGWIPASCHIYASNLNVDQRPNVKG